MPVKTEEEPMDDTTHMTNGGGKTGGGEGGTAGHRKSKVKQDLLTVQRSAVCLLP